MRSPSPVDGDPRVASAPGGAFSREEGMMRYLLVLLVGLTLGCGVAANFTASLASASASDGERGYENTWTDAR